MEPQRNLGGRHAGSPGKQKQQMFFAHILVTWLENANFCLKEYGETQLNINKLYYIVTGR